MENIEDFGFIQLANVKDYVFLGVLGTTLPWYLTGMYHKYFSTSYHLYAMPLGNDICLSHARKKIKLLKWLFDPNPIFCTFKLNIYVLVNSFKLSCRGADGHGYQVSINIFHFQVYLKISYVVLLDKLTNLWVFPNVYLKFILCRYVVEKDVKNNVVFVSRNYFSVDKRRRLFRVGSLKWLSGSPPSQINQLQCKVWSSILVTFTVWFISDHNAVISLV